jgi:Fe-S-cluster-containing dehydrogenase component
MLSPTQDMDKADITSMCADLGLGGGIKLKLQKGVEAAKAGGGAPTPPQTLPNATPRAVGVGGGGAYAPAPPAHVAHAMVVPSGAPAPGMGPCQPPTTAPHGQCALCHSKGIQKNAYPGSPYCNNTCVREAKAAGWVKGAPPGFGQPVTAVTVSWPGFTPAAGPPAGMCGFCGQKPLSPPHPYCGKTCADNAAAAGMTTPRSPAPAPALSTAPASGTCKFCWSRAVSAGQPFCSGTCAQNAQTAGWVGGTPPGGAPQPTTPVTVAQPPLGLSPVALAPALPCPPHMCTMCHSKGISKPAFQGPPASPYCGRSCVNEAKAAGWVPGSPGIGLPVSVVSPAVRPAAVQTYKVVVPIDPAALGMILCKDLTISSVTPNSPIDSKGVLKGSTIC